MNVGYYAKKFKLARYLITMFENQFNRLIVHYLHSQFFTWNEFSKGCGIRKFTPSNYIRVTGQSTATRTGEVLQDFVLVGKAILIEDRGSCLEACHLDDKCLSCSYNDDTSANPNVCVFNYGPKERTLNVPNAGISSAMKNCSNTGV